MSDPKLSRPLLRRPAAWAFSALGALMAFITAFGYLGAFLDPDGNARNLPIGIVVADAGGEVGGQPVVLGDEVLAQVTAPNPELGDMVAWQVLADRGAAVDAIRRDDLFAALVIPANFTRRLLAIADPAVTDPSPATVEVLTNPASGSYAGTFSQTVATRAVDAVSAQASVQLTALLTAASRTVPPSVAAVLGRPVEATVTVAHPIGDRTGRGIAPFYFAVVLTLGAVLGTSIVNLGIEFLQGRERLEVLGRTVRRPAFTLTASAAWRTKLVATMAMAVAGAWAATWMAVGILGMEVGNVWKLGAFSTLAMAAMATVTLLLYTAFDVGGSLLAVFFTTIFGVPSAGGVYPAEALPEFFRFLGSFLPLRYITDGTRALIYFDGAAAGLGRSLAVLAAYLAGAVLLAWTVTRRIDRRATPVRLPGASIGAGELLSADVQPTRELRGQDVDERVSAIT